MKKNLTFLTGIVFLITILVAGSCGNGKKQNDSTKETNAAKLVDNDSKKPTIYLKDSVIDGRMHLFMFDEKKRDCGVIDDHIVVVKRGYTVKWKNAEDSKINRIEHIRPVGDSTFFGAVAEVETTDVDSTEVFSISRGIFKLVIPDTAKFDTLVKYEIKFTVKEEKDTTYIIDPYLKVPPKDPTH